MTRILVLTDIHFAVGRSGDPVDPAIRLHEAIDHARTHLDRIDKVIVSGDLADKGDVASYALLRETLAPFELPITLMVGNHDNRENFLSVFLETETDENGHVQQIIDFPTHRVVTLDTLDGPPYDYPLSHRGFLCDKRLSWLDRALATAGDKPCLVFMHHPPHDLGFRGMDAIKLVNGDEFYEVVEGNGNVCQILCGHIHRTISGHHRGIPFFTFKSTAEQMPMVFESRKTSLETLEPPAYGIVDLGKAGITIHTEDFGLTDLDQYG